MVSRWAHEAGTVTHQMRFWFKKAILLGLKLENIKFDMLVHCKFVTLLADGIIIII